MSVVMFAHVVVTPSNGKGLLLVPKTHLRALPGVNPQDFWDYCWDNHNEKMRNDFNYDVKRRVSKKAIIGLARENQFLVRAYLEDREGKPYPRGDPRFLSPA